MKLHWSPRSPYVRKVMIVLKETGLEPRVELSRNVVALHMPTPQAVLADNPLGKIPVLITDAGKPIYDSRVICEYLDGLAGGGFFPADNALRMEHLTWQSLGDGLTDILLLWRTELARPAGAWEAVTDAWRIKIRAGMRQLEADAPRLSALPLGIGQVSVICALGQLDFRWTDCNWRRHFPALAAFHAQMLERPSVRDTVPDDDNAGDNVADITAGHLWFDQ
ncbi:glutathione S-transferase family protein [Pseudoprimorskyibacter insulae]|uniref:Putative GST-like protein YibF n=1 Tax=Pseudoprimorskyibacter insulae TaxID=1695997 RepID=A0A2R8B0Q3_9RHOB|nr:glutathione S-transferase N-terminal domain-containing protein [Pseudoprimorskyibacter insulae]SPF81724.1 putative GST-like protein YibF [Pseudoprimorskyibacter insulae]